MTLENSQVPFFTSERVIERRHILCVRDERTKVLSIPGLASASLPTEGTKRFQIENVVVKLLDPKHISDCLKNTIVIMNDSYSLNRYPVHVLYRPGGLDWRKLDPHTAYYVAENANLTLRRIIQADYNLFQLLNEVAIVGSAASGLVIPNEPHDLDILVSASEDVQNRVKELWREHAFRERANRIAEENGFEWVDWWHSFSLFEEQL